MLPRGILGVVVFFLPVPSRYTGGRGSWDYHSQTPERVAGHVARKDAELVGGGPAGAPHLSVTPGARGSPLVPRPHHGARGRRGDASPRVRLGHLRGPEEDEQAPGNGGPRGGRARGRASQVGLRQGQRPATLARGLS